MTIDRDLRTQAVFTSGEVAKIVQVSPRTVGKWFAAGRFAGSYRIPGSNGRRIPRKSLKRFLAENGMEQLCPDLFHTRTLVLAGLSEHLVTALTTPPLCGDTAVCTARTLFDLGLLVVECPEALVIDCSIGTQDVMHVAAQMAVGGTRVVVLAAEDWTGGDEIKGVTVLRHPVAAEAIVEALTKEG